MTRGALLALLLVLPFQTLLAEALPPARWLDEIALVALLPVAFLRRRAGRAFPGEGAFLLALGLLLAAAGLSAAVNRVPLVPAALGTFDYAKAFVWFWLFGLLAADRRWLDRAYRLVLHLAVAGAAVALGQEILALVRGEGHMRRLGLFRVPSFFGHPNLMGLYLLPVFLMQAARGTRASARLGLLYAGLFLSLSRMVHGAFFALSALLLQRRLWLAIPLSLSAGVLALTTGLTLEEQGLGEGDAAQERAASHYRAYARERALAVWRDHRVLGAGPGRYGGVVSLVTGSPLYERYPWEPGHRAFLERIRSLDQFLPQLLAELGIVGALGFAALFAATARVLWFARRADPARGTGFLLALGTVPFLCLGSGLNQAHVLVTVLGLGGAWAGQSES